ncbi:DNA polymerase I [Pajaroellobacter abortibovis]|uniref:DNA polymerase I n=1 Tax=Pajaroellobacter abortibovis TaxID=1882918 RepID=A0A1L6MWM7_9BACT|nr:DNA polymerase I [Pajaroellobacter abortibovis]APR99817.1 DNA polymerase I [Pajaroellobacter abortibovis]
MLSSLLPPPNTEDVLYVLDFSGYIFRAYHAVAPLCSSQGEPTHAVFGAISMLQKLLSDRLPHRIAVVMDSKSPTFRHDLDPRYKAHRPPPPPGLSRQMQRCEEIARAYHLSVFQEDGWEADDLIASLVRRAVAAGWQVVIVSSDKDLLQLLEDQGCRVLMWDSMRDRVFGPDEVRQKYGVPPSQLRELFSLIGDASDHIPGVRGIGPKAAVDLIGRYRSVDNLYAHLASVEPSRLRMLLERSASDVQLSYRLITLQDVAIDWNPARLVWRPGEGDAETLRRIFKELDFHQWLKRRELSSSAVTDLNAGPYCMFELDAVRALVEEARLLGAISFDLFTTDRNDPTRASLVGLSLAVRPEAGGYVPLAHRYLGVPDQLSWLSVKQLLQPLFEDPRIVKVGHDLKYDLLVLSELGVEVHGHLFDTMVASHLLNPGTIHSIEHLRQQELGIPMSTYEEITRKQRGAQMMFEEVSCEDASRYASTAVQTCIALFERWKVRLEEQGLFTLFEEVEMPLLRVLTQMERTGVLVDPNILVQLGKTVEALIQQLQSRAKALAGREFAIRSRDQLETILFDELQLPVIKRTPKKGRSTDAQVLEELANHHELPRVILEYRELDKLKSTYIDALPKSIHHVTHRIHTHFNQAATITGRLVSYDPNLQNVPIRTALGKQIRSAFIAPEGFCLVSGDYSQIELRVLAHLSEDEELIAAFRSGQDVHIHTATLLFEVAPEQVTPEMRRRAKAINFGVIYGMGEAALAKSIGIEREEAARFIASYFERHQGVAQFMKEVVEQAYRGEPIRTLLGRTRHFPALRSAHQGLRAEAERMVKNAPIQGGAADILKLAMIQLGKPSAVPGGRLVLTVHDELVFEVEVDRLAEAKKKVREVMESAYSLRVPLVVDIGSGANWAQAH